MSTGGIPVSPPATINVLYAGEALQLHLHCMLTSPFVHCRYIVNHKLQALPKDVFANYPTSGIRVYASCWACAHQLRRSVALLTCAPGTWGCFQLHAPRAPQMRTSHLRLEAATASATKTAKHPPTRPAWYSSMPCCSQCRTLDAVGIGLAFSAELSVRQ